MLLNDMLADTAAELQAVEEKQRKSEVVHESKQLAENLMKHIVDYQSEESLVQMKWAGEKNIA